MNWYKLSGFDLHFFDDRNVLNNNVKFFLLAREYLKKLAKLVFQNGRLAKSINNQIMQHKKISSYPQIRDVLIEADKIALDSPWKFAAFCQIAMDEIDKKVFQLEKERIEFVESTLPHKMKGFTDGNER